MKRLVLFFLVLLILGCATESEVHDYEHYNKSPGFDSFIQGDGYKLWYDKEFRALFTEAEKGSIEWKVLQKFMGNAPIDRAFINSKSGFMAVIGKFRYKIPYDKMLKIAKKSSTPAIIESDLRIVNSKLVLYMRSFAEKNDTRTMVSTYYINIDAGSLLFMIGCSNEDYKKYRIMILKTLNSIEVD
jgi:hypothetical protein